MSQVPVEQTPTPPTPPAPPTPPVGVGQAGPATPNVLQPPTTQREVNMLRQRGSELSRQLTSANGRRDELAGQLEDAVGTNRAGIESRIAQLDQRIMRIEADIAENGRLLAMAPPGSLREEGTTAPPPGSFNLNSNQITGITIVGTIFVLFPLALAMARNIWRRGSRQAPAPVSHESTERMERLEQAVDAIAIEVERISEGQRFVTRVLTEGSAQPFAVGQKSAEPARLPDRDSIRAARETA
jgi:hypothetical protein